MVGGLVGKSYSTLCDPMNCCPPDSSPWDFPGKNTGVGCLFPSAENFPIPGIEPVSPALQVDSLLTEPPGKSMLRHKCASIDHVCSTRNIFILNKGKKLTKVMNI